MTRDLERRLSAVERRMQCAVDPAAVAQAFACFAGTLDEAAALKAGGNPDAANEPLQALLMVIPGLAGAPDRMG